MSAKRTAFSDGQYEYRSSAEAAPDSATPEQHVAALLRCYEGHPADAEVSVGEVRENLRKLRLNIKARRHER